MFLPKTRIMFPQGRNDFKEIVTNYYYIDKTLFIQEWWYSSDFISLFARPRCFGKTLCMSCVDYFFSDRYYNTRNLFENLEISKCHEIMKLQGQFPVIFLSFSDLMNDDPITVIKQIKYKIWQVYLTFKDRLKKSDKIDDSEKSFIDLISYEMDDMIAVISIQSLCIFLNKIIGDKRTILILDDFDKIYRLFFNFRNNRHCESVKYFITSFILKTFNEQYLFRVLITGVMDIPCSFELLEKVNISVFSMHSNKYLNCFGFTENEMEKIIHNFSDDVTIDFLRYWYGGYRVGFSQKVEVFNPYSISQFIDSTSNLVFWFPKINDDYLREIILFSSSDFKSDLIDLIQGKVITAILPWQMNFFSFQIFDNTSIYVSLFHSGILTIANDNSSQLSDVEFKLKVTNNDANEALVRIICEILARKRNHIEFIANSFIKNYERGKIENMINQFICDKYFPINNPTSPINVLHLLFLGLTAIMRNSFNILLVRSANNEFYVLFKSLNLNTCNHSYIIAVFQRYSYGNGELVKNTLMVNPNVSEFYSLCANENIIEIIISLNGSDDFDGVNNDNNNTAINVNRQGNVSIGYRSDNENDTIDESSPASFHTNNEYSNEEDGSITQNEGTRNAYEDDSNDVQSNDNIKRQYVHYVDLPSDFSRNDSNNDDYSNEGDDSEENQSIEQTEDICSLMTGQPKSLYDSVINPSRFDNSSTNYYNGISDYDDLSNQQSLLMNGPYFGQNTNSYSFNAGTCVGNRSNIQNNQNIQNILSNANIQSTQDMSSIQAGESVQNSASNQNILSYPIIQDIQRSQVISNAQNTRSNQSDQNIQNAQNTQNTRSIRSNQSDQNAQNTQNIQSTRSNQSDQNIQNARSIRSNQSDQNIQNTQNTRSIRSNQSDQNIQNARSTRSNQSDQNTQNIQSTRSNQSDQNIQNIQSTRSNQSDQNIQNTQNTQSTRSNQSDQNAQNARSTRSNQSDQNIQNIQSTRSNQSDQNTQNIQSTRSNQSDQNIQNIQSTRSNQSDQNIQNTQNTQSTRSNQSDQNAQNARSTRSNQSDQNTQNIQSTRSNQSDQNIQNIQSTRSNQSDQNIQNTQSTRSNQSDQNAQNTQSTRSNQSDQNIQNTQSTRSNQSDQNAQIARIISILQSARIIPIPQSAQSIPIPQSAQSIPIPQSAQSIPIPQSAQSIPIPQSAQSIPIPQSAQSIPIPQSAQNAQSIPIPQSAQSIPIPQSARIIPIPQSAQNAQSIQSTRIARIIPIPQSAQSIPIPQSAQSIPIPQSAQSIPIPQSAQSMSFAQTSILSTNNRNSRNTGLGVMDLDDTEKLFDAFGMPAFDVSNKHFHIGEGVYVIHKNKYDIYEAVIDNIIGYKYHVSYPDYPNDNETVNGTDRILKMSKQNNDIFFYQESERLKKEAELQKNRKKRKYTRRKKSTEQT